MKHHPIPNPRRRERMLNLAEIKARWPDEEGDNFANLPELLAETETLPQSPASTQGS